MTSIEFTTGDKHIYDDTEFTPVYAIINGKKRFVKNISHSLSGDTNGWNQYFDKMSIADVENAKKNLMEHDGKYITFYALNDNPFLFLDWIKENNYTLQVVRDFFVESSNGDFTDFHGNSCEYSCSFFYRFYDETMLWKIKDIISNMKKHIR